jgi:hypothetical protein
LIGSWSSDRGHVTGSLPVNERLPKSTSATPAPSLPGSQAATSASISRNIGTAVATLCDLLNPELIVVGGELRAAGDVLLDPLREQVHRHAIPATARGLEIVPSVLGPRAELLGTLALVLASDGVPA